MRLLLIPDAWNEFLKLLTCGSIIAAAVLPLASLCWGITRWLKVPLRPRFRPWPVPWSGVDVTLIMAIVVLLPSVVSEVLGQTLLFEWIYGLPTPLVGENAPLESTSAGVAGTAAALDAHQQLAARVTIRGLWAGLLALPLQISGILFLRVTLYPQWKSRPTWTCKDLPALIFLAMTVWCVLTPIVFLIHLGSGYFSSQIGSNLDDHPLTKIAASGWKLDRALFVLQACVVSPLMEEWICRGILLPWATRRLYRPWFVLASALGVAALVGSTAANSVNRYGSLVFVLLVIMMWSLVASRLRDHRKVMLLSRWGGVIASSAMFAALHAAVWPSPIPLFALALGLGWLALATRGILASVIVHGLFNAVSVIYVLEVAG